ncbi:MAG: DDE-type integrase/transposase/recombinase [Deltaproteobacteria bacterium]|nr:DDE-type integrase/transposase/recombinase [Deltaproteobacteria bacterium]
MKESAVLDCWKCNPGFGPGQVRGQLRRQGITVSIRSIRKILKANGYTPIGKKPAKQKSQRFEARRPLELAQIDILEFFINKAKVYLILLMDDFSRFIIGWRLLDQTSVDAVISVVSDAIDRYRKMEEILTDLGFVFYSWRGINRLEKYLEVERIDHTHARPHHPQTLGKIEACNRRVKQELIDQKRFLNLHAAQTAEIGFINRSFAPAQLEEEVQKVCRRLVSLPAETVATAKTGLNGALDAQGFGNAISYGEEIAIFNGLRSETNPQSQAFHRTVRDKGLKEAIKRFRDYSQGGSIDEASWKR